MVHTNSDGSSPNVENLPPVLYIKKENKAAGEALVATMAHEYSSQNTAVPMEMLQRYLSTE